MRHLLCACVTAGSMVLCPVHTETEVTKANAMVVSVTYEPSEDLYRVVLETENHNLYVYDFEDGDVFVGDVYEVEFNGQMEIISCPQYVDAINCAEWYL